MAIVARNRGFTLIELSIVLIIIGLLAGAVLVGRDLIEAAVVRSQITQIEQFQTSVTTFRLKYNALPGDIAAAQAAAFGLQPRAGTAYHGDGDQKLTACEQYQSNLVLGCETALFWRDLSETHLISQSLTAAVDDYATGDSAPGNASIYMPAAKLGHGNLVAVFNDLFPRAGQPRYCGRNFCFAVGQWFVAGHGGLGGVVKITPQQAYNMDIKVDDGYPQSGSWLAGTSDSNSVFPFVTYLDAFVHPTRTSNSCYSVSPPYSYNLRESADTAQCFINVVN